MKYDSICQTITINWKEGKNEVYTLFALYYRSVAGQRLSIHIWSHTESVTATLFTKGGRQFVFSVTLGIERRRK
jgi:hypothetical protein